MYRLKYLFLFLILFGLACEQQENLDNAEREISVSLWRGGTSFFGDFSIYPDSLRVFDPNGFEYEVLGPYYNGIFQLKFTLQDVSLLPTRTFLLDIEGQPKRDTLTFFVSNQRVLRNLKDVLYNGEICGFFETSHYIDIQVPPE